MIRHLASASTVIALLVSAASSAKAQLAYYDYQTGQIWFDELTGQAGITLISSEEVLSSDNWNGFGQINDDALAPHKLAWAKFAGFQGGPFDGGVVMPPGVDWNTLSVELTSIGAPVDVLPALGAHASTVPPMGRGFYAIVLPEPVTFMLSGIGLVGLLAIRWRCD